MRWGKIVWFLTLTLLLSWGLAGVFFARGGTLTSPWALPVLLLYMFMPMTAALIVQKGIYREPVVKPLGIRLDVGRLGWFAAALVLPALLALAAFGVSLLLPEIRFSPNMEGMIAQYRDRLTPEALAAMQRQIAAIPWPALLALLIVQGLFAGATINLIAAFGEELGWRGLLVRELAPLRFWPAALVIGIVWGIWHAPIIWQGYNYPEHPRIGVLLMTAFTVLFTPLITYLRLRARSVFAAALMHGTLNGTAGVSFVFLAGGSDLTRGVLGAAGFIVLAALNVGLLIYDRRLLREPMGMLLADEMPPGAEG
jgi:membrane protease YdiL (CAAX protease family)